MMEAMLYEKLPNQSVRCHLCFHRCVIADKKRGFCHVRENQNGVLYALNYGLTIAASVDPIEKKPLYHFLPNTWIYSFAAQGCNFKCPWCQNYDISQVTNPNDAVEGIEITPEEHVKRALKAQTPAIAYTYSEPTVFFEYALATMKCAHEAHLKNVWVSNGAITEEALALLIPFLDAANIDYKGDEDVYNHSCYGNLKQVQTTLKLLFNAHVHIEITTLIIPGINDTDEHFRRIANFIFSELSPDVPWHISRFFPHWKLLTTPITPLSTLKRAQKIGYEAGLTTIHIGNV